MMVVGRNDYGEWQIHATDAEFHDLHHALRMLAKHPLTPHGEELQRITDSADALWNAHAAYTREQDVKAAISNSSRKTADPKRNIPE